MILDPPFLIDGNPGITMYAGWHPPSYEGAVALVITRIHNRGAGRALIESLRYRVRIIPFNNVQANICDARTNVHAPRTFPRVAGAIRHGRVIPLRGGRSITGTGIGAPSEIRFTPGHFVASSALYCQPAGAGVASDEVLVHEMVHAAVNSEGVNDTQPLPAALGGFQSRGEYIAVIITNVYSSEIGRALRGQYPGFGVMQNPDNFYANPNHARMIRQICDDLPVLTYRLARVPSRFNPFRECYREREGLAPSSARAVASH